MAALLATVENFGKQTGALRWGYPVSAPELTSFRLLTFSLIDPDRQF